MFRFSLIFIFILSFSFSHQFENPYQGAIPSFAKTPNEGKISINEIYEIRTAKKWYGAGGKTTAIDKWEAKNAIVVFDYFGKNGAGLQLIHKISKIEQLTNKWDLSQNDFGVYYLWNKINDKIDLHDLTFNLTKIKSGIFNRSVQLETNGVEGTRLSAKYFSFAIDFIISNNFIWTNYFETKIKDDDYIFTPRIRSRLIYDISDKNSIALEFERMNGPSNTDLYGNSLTIFGAHQFLDIQWGNLNFNLKISPYYSHSLSGKNFYKLNITGIEFNTYFK